MAHLRQDHCKQLAFTSDDALLAKGGFLVNNSQLWWSLKFVHERFAACGDARVFFKWVGFLVRSVRTCRLVPEDQSEWIHRRTAQQPEGALHETVGRSSCVIAYVGWVLINSRLPSQLAAMKEWLPKICARACEMAPSSLEMENMLPLSVTAGGLVKGMARSLMARHNASFLAWKIEWDAMLGAGTVSSNWDANADSVLLSDLALFAFLVERQKRAKGGHVWSATSQSGACLHALQVGLVNFLSQHMDKYVLEKYMRDHDCDQLVPSSSKRRLSGESDGPNGKRARVTMSNEGIWEVIQASKECGLSGREVLNFLKKAKRFSAAAGNDPSVVDSWLRRWQTLYDESAAISFAGATHINLVADASRHAGKEVLVSCAWTWENQTAAMANVQVLLPVEQIAPQEMELCDLVEQAAKDTSW